MLACRALGILSQSPFALLRAWGSSLLYLIARPAVRISQIPHASMQNPQLPPPRDGPVFIVIFIISISQAPQQDLSGHAA